MSDPSKLFKNILLLLPTLSETYFQADGLISHSLFPPQLTGSLSTWREDHAREEPGKNCSAELQLLKKKILILI